MAYDRFLIAPINSGLQTDLKPWLVPDDAFEVLNNAYVYRGRIKKRFGTKYTGLGTGTTAQLQSRVRIDLGLTDGAGNAAGNVPGIIYKIGQAFSVGSEIFTVTTAGNPAVMLTTGAATVHTYSTATGAYVINGAAVNTRLYFYPAEPIMGIGQCEIGTVNNQPTFAFDTQFAYLYAGGVWGRSLTGAVPLFTSSNSQFMQISNWRGANANTTMMFVTNYKPNEMAYFNGTTSAWTQPWTQGCTIAPATVVTLIGAKIILPFKDRLVLLNTIESVGGATTYFTNRCRYSHNGSPFDASAFYEKNVVGYTGGGYIDAPTKEQIIGAEYIKDRLIVYFEQSTWELAYTGNNILPFIWQKLNTELGSQAMLSSVPFDKAILTVGKTGVHACNGVNVERVDQKIPLYIFQVRNTNNGADRICGIRDYYTEMVYWSLPLGSKTTSSTNVYPNKVLVFNYNNGSWAFNDDCITAFGYFEQQTDRTWANIQSTWNGANFTWVDGIILAQSRRILAGNQQGYISLVDPDFSYNTGLMQLTNVNGNQLTIRDHTLAVGDFIKIENGVGIVPILNYRVIAIVDADNILVDTPIAGTYLGGGTVARVSNIEIRTKEFNPYADKGKNVYLAKVDFCVTKTTNGQITVDYAPSSTNLSMIGEADATNCNLGSNVLETSPYALIPLEQEQRQLWHPIYFQTDGEYIQLSMYFDDTQMRVDAVTRSDFELQGMVLYTTPISRLQ